MTVGHTPLLYQWTPERRKLDYYRFLAASDATAMLRRSLKAWKPVPRSAARRTSSNDAPSRFGLNRWSSFMRSSLSRKRNARSGRGRQGY